MKNQKQNAVWICAIVAVLGLAAVVIVAEAFVPARMGKSVHDTLLILGLVTGTGLVRLLFPYLLI